mmetsp:Transcript_60921/g.89321  ORF Transcript_60921/g.89321 Transcript_60921/m.89321 type:complete len:235 (-) Transcript_60921:82-786(-)
MSMGGFHFVTGEFSSHKSFLPDLEYASGLDNFVKGCSDMLVTNSKGQVFTGKRVVHPQPDWWYVGGRMMPGESPARSCTRLLKRELGLVIASERFTPITYNSLVWGMREQEPKNNGTCDVNIVLTVELNDDEISSIVLDEKEYAESKWIEIDELITGAYHPALQYSARSLQAHKTLVALRTAVTAGSSDADVAALARLLVEHSADPRCGTSEYVVKSELACHAGYAGHVTTSRS